MVACINSESARLKEQPNVAYFQSNDAGEEKKKKK